MALGVVAEAGEALAKAIKASVNGMSTQDAKVWLRENQPDVPTRMSALVISYGYAKDRGLWYRDGDMLVPGAKPAPRAAQLQPREPAPVPIVNLLNGNGHVPVPANMTIPPLPAAPVQPSLVAAPLPLPQPTLTDLRTQLLEVALGNGIASNWANSIAYYLSQSYDLEDPEAVWNGLLQVTEVPASHRKRFFRTWMAYIGAEVPLPLDAKVKAHGTGAASVTQDQAAQQTSKHPAGRFIAVDGEVHRCGPDDEEMGVSWNMALQMAKQQVEKMRAIQPAPVPVAAKEGDTVAVELIKQMGENSRQTLDMMQGSGGEDPEKKMLAEKLNEERIARVEEKLTSKMELQTERTERQIEALASKLETPLSDLAKAVNLLAQNQNKPQAGPLDSLTQLVDLKEKLAVLFPQPKAESPYMLPVGPNGEAWPLDAYMKFTEMQDRRDTMKFVREQFPGLIQLGQDMTEAMKRQPGAAAGPIPLGPRTEQPELPQVPTGMVQQNCPGCSQLLYFPPSEPDITCPQCRLALTTVDGKLTRWEAPPASAPVQSGPTVPQPEQQPVGTPPPPAQPEPAPVSQILPVAQPAPIEEEVAS